ncbi:hypothetical protein [Vibrio sp. 1F255]|uniref:hypothetical protein n=1 Tax=Vibrio sp. 1F255 TaxID=3230009 RepID=UPI00352E9720
MLSESECLGFPCSGKSWVLSNVLEEEHCGKKIYHHNHSNFKKMCHVIFSPKKINVLWFLIKLSNSNKNTFKYNVKKSIILMSRLGIFKFQNKFCVEEGVFQSLWGWLNTLPLSENNMKLVSNLLDVINTPSHVYYIITDVEKLTQRADERVRKHRFNTCSTDEFMVSNKWMEFLLKEIKRRSINLVTIKN